MNQPFCRLASNQLRFEYDEISPCCWIKRKASVKDPAAIQEYIEWLHNINDWIPECSYCKDLERKGLQSGRTRANNVSFTLFNDFIGSGNDVLSLELQIDGDCNGACLICSDKNSSTWRKYSTPGNRTIKISIDNDVKSTAQIRLNTVFEYIDFSHIKLITFLGGEPLKNDNHLKVIEKIQQHQDIQLVKLSYVTNGSYLPSEDILDLWKQFKSVRLNVSIDGIYDHFNYLRWPLSFKQIEDNLDYLFKQQIDNLTIKSSYCVTPFSIFYHDRYLNWAEQKGFTHFFRNPFESTGIINTAVIPPKLHQILLEKYQGTNITKLIRPFNFINYQKFLNYIKEHDLKRGIDWRSVFPEISEYFFDIKS